MQLTKRGDLVGSDQDGHFFIESRFAADPRCSADIGDDVRGRRATAVYALVIVAGCASAGSGRLQDASHDVHILGGNAGRGWHESVLDVRGRERLHVGLAPLIAVEGGVVAVELILARSATLEENLLGERSPYSESCRCYPEKPFVIDIAHVGAEIAKSRYGSIRRFPIPRAQSVLVFDVRNVTVGYGVGMCDTCPRIESLDATVSIRPK
jgi:hypothetical protein